MDVRIVRKYRDQMPADDDHPYRTGAWRPNFTEYDATNLTVVEGVLPPDLKGIYLRNTENPLLPAIGRYHPFDGDGMLHAIRFADGRAHYRNRMVQTVGLQAEIEAGEPLWAGIIESPSLSKRDGWGARSRMKDASSTDVVVHAGCAVTSFYQCGDLYEHDPVTFAPRGRSRWEGAFPSWGVSAHPKLDPATGELLFFSYSTEAPYLRYGVLDARGALVHQSDVPLPGARLPHDMAFTEHFAILNDLPLFWRPEDMARGTYRPRYHAHLPSRFAVLPRRGSAADVRWFEAEPTYVLHWINAYERGHEIVLDGFRQGDPMARPAPEDGLWGPLKRQVDLCAMRTQPVRYCFDLRTGKTRQELLLDELCEFPSIHGAFVGRTYRKTCAMTPQPGWFLFNGMVMLDFESRSVDRLRLPEGVYASEAPIAPRTRSAREDEAYVVTFVSDLNQDRSECWILDARRISDGPIARVLLPERICSGTHACWTPETALHQP